MPLLLKTVLGVSLAVFILVVPLTYAHYHHSQARNFKVVCPGVLYRSGQLSRPALQRVLNDYGIRTVVSLRDGRMKSDIDEELFCLGEEVSFVRILPSKWGDEGGSVPVHEGVNRFCEILRDPRNHPVLVHCYGGVHRAGTFSAIYRMEFEHWTSDQAIAELKACGYTTIDHENDIRGFLENYCPTWRRTKPAPAAVTASHSRSCGDKQARCSACP